MVFTNFIFNFDSIAGLRYTVDVTKPTGEKIRIESLADGTPFDFLRDYSVAMTAYRANGGGELLTKGDVQSVLNGKRMVFNQPILEKILQRFRRSVLNESMRQEAFLDYDIDEYEAWCSNKLYNKAPFKTRVTIQTDRYRQLYDTTELIQGLLKLDYLSDEEILRNQGAYAEFMDGSKDGQKAYRKAMKRRR